MSEGACARFVCRVPTSSEGMPRNGASRTPALELPTMQAAFFISSEKWAKRIDGQDAEAVLRQAVDDGEDRLGPGIVVGGDHHEVAARGVERAERASACAPMVSASEVTGWKTAMP